MALPLPDMLSANVRRMPSADSLKKSLMLNGAAAANTVTALSSGGEPALHVQGLPGALGLVGRVQYVYFPGWPRVD